MVSHKSSVTNSLAIFSCYPLNGFVRLTKSTGGIRRRLLQGASVLPAQTRRGLRAVGKVAALRSASVQLSRGPISSSVNGRLMDIACAASFAHWAW
jgi:hypothetical protein